MLHRDINDVTVRGLTEGSELTVTLAPGAEGVTAEVESGLFEHQLTFADGTHLTMRPKWLQPSAQGVITLSVPPGLTVTMVDCHAKWVRPDGAVQQLDGGSITWVAA